MVREIIEGENEAGGICPERFRNYGSNEMVLEEGQRGGNWEGEKNANAHHMGGTRANYG